MPEAKIYNYDPKTDGWKTFAGADTKTIKIDQKQRGIREYEIPYTHYVRAGKTLCGLEGGDVDAAKFYNDSRNQCDGCREGVRQQTKEAFALRDAGDESKNVVDYKVAAAKDNPKSSSVSH